MRHTLWLGILLLIVVCPPGWGQTTTDPCVPTPTSLCLNNDRFQVEVQWRDAFDNPDSIGDFDGGGFGRNTPISDVWTGMWFFDPDNLDLLIHVFQGCSFNDRYWVFAGALTNVEVTLTVTDTQTGEEKEFFNPLGMPFEPITDTEAFATCPKSLGPPLPRVAPVAPQPPRLLGGCSENNTTACLHEGRFEVTVEAFGSNQPLQRLADGTAGLFLTGNPSFFDTFVSIVDASAANGQYWVKYSVFPGTPSFTLSVTDTVEGGTQTYDFDGNGPLFVQDQAAFEGDDVIPIDGTLAGSWFATERDGEGFIFDIAVVGGVPTLVLYYFTFENNSSGRQAWVIGSAPLIGNKASIPVIIADGAQFGAPFDPADVTRTDWGNVKVTVLECNRILIESNSTLFPAVSYEAMRLTPAPIGVQGACQAPAKASAAAPAGIAIDGGYSGSWFRVDRDGEGFIFNIAEFDGVPTLVLFYFTYENNTSGRQAWLVGSAPIMGNMADVPVVVASGAQFGDGFDPDDVVRTPAGNIKVTWQSCTLATVEVTSPLGNLSFDIMPLTGPPIGATGVCAN